MEEKKFFDKQPVLTCSASLDYQLDQLRECLKSEGIDLSLSDLYKTIDTYLRVYGFENDNPNGDYPLAIHIWIGFITFNDVSNLLEESDFELLKNCFRDTNEKFDYKIEAIDTILKDDNLKIVIKEISIFMNEVVNSLYTALSVNKEVPIRRIQYISVLNDKENIENAEEIYGLSFSTLYTDKTKSYVIEIISTSTCKNMPQAIDIRADTLRGMDKVE